MKPARYDITIHQRATFRERFKLPINATGYSIVAQVWSKRREELLLSFSVQWVNQAQGEFDLYASRTATRGVTKSGEWDLLVIEPGGDGFYWLEGTATLDPGQSDTV
jgi:hypothetical protein